MTNPLDEIVSETIDNTPPVSPVANRPDINPVIGETFPTDSEGRTVSQSAEYPIPSSPVGTQSDIFDPAIHSTNTDGTPRLTKTGKYRLRPGRKNDTMTVGGGDTHQAKAKAAADATAQTIVMLGFLLGGDEWRPKKNDATGEDEMKALTEAYTGWFLTMEEPNVPAWAAAAIVTGAYILPRLRSPVTSERLSGLYRKVGTWVAGLRNRGA